MTESVTIVPAGAGTAVSRLTSQGTGGEGDLWTGWWKNYRLEATPAEGYVFLRFEVDYEYHGHDGDSSGTSEYTRNPAGGEEGPDWSPGSLTEYSTDYSETGEHYDHTIVEVRAIFEKIESEVVVSVSLRPSEAVDSGATATVDGSSESRKTGTPGGVDTFHLTARAPEGWKFRYWKLNGIKFTKDQEQTLVESFPSAGTTKSVAVLAVFTEVTGEILCAEDDGVILHGSTGVPLFNG